VSAEPEDESDTAITYGWLSILMPLVLAERILRNLDVPHHPLRRLGKGRTRLDLEFGEHVAFGVIRDGPIGDEPLGEVRVVVFLKVVLLDKEAEEGDRLVEHLIDFIFSFLRAWDKSAPRASSEKEGDTHAFETLLEVLVDEKRDVLWRLRVLIDKDGESLVTDITPSASPPYAPHDELTSLIDFSNALSLENALSKIKSNLSLRSSTFCTHDNAAFVFALPPSAAPAFALPLPVSIATPSFSFPFPFRSCSSSPGSETINSPSLTCFPTSTIHLEVLACNAACPVGTRPKRVYSKRRSSIRESWIKVDRPEAEWSRIEVRWVVMSVLSRSVMRRGSVVEAR
jgi:hypothetical protein